MIARWCLLIIVTVTLGSPVVAQNTSQHTLEEGIRELANNIADRMKARNIGKVAVVEFPDLNGYQSALGDFVAEELITSLFLVSPDGFDVVERRLLARVLKEQKLTTSGLFDPASIATVGNILGIQAIVAGSITYLGDEVKINARLIGVETAKIFAAASVTVPKRGAVEELTRQSSGSVSHETDTGDEPRPQVQRHDVYFQNSFLRVDVMSISKSGNKRDVTLSLVFQNLTQKEVF